MVVVAPPLPGFKLMQVFAAAGKAGLFLSDFRTPCICDEGEEGAVTP